AIGLGIRAAVFVPQAAITVLRPEIFGVGLVLALAGIAYRWYAIARLGRFFNTRVTVTSDQVVVDTGPYRLVRHPSYSGALLTLFGILLASTNLLSLACFLLALPGMAYRISGEEEALTVGLGQPYRDYMQRTKRLIPFVADGDVRGLVPPAVFKTVCGALLRRPGWVRFPSIPASPVRPHR
ncbi:MAG: isoprenylcysteine carboxylmethyltransferase family protein, partial [Chloroflexi bacterium]